MSKKGSEFYDNFTKDIFETVKGISNDDRGKYIIETYGKLYERLAEADEPRGTVVDLAKLREELSHIRGIGGQRLDEIMAVIERNLVPEARPGSGQSDISPASDGYDDADDEQ